MLFSDYFHVDKNTINEYGAVDISLFSDLPLFIDPLLIFGNDDELIRQQYQKIVDYLFFLKEKASKELTKQEVKYYFTFPEIKNNWLGVCRHGNVGSALGNTFAEDLSNNILNICETNGGSESIHVEKMYLIHDGVGRDKISDWTVNILLGFFVDYTAKFAADHLDDSYCKVFEIQRYSFNYSTGLFEDKMVKLPFIIKPNGKKEYVLLTPKSILRKDEQEICKRNFDLCFDDLRETLPNDVLRFKLNKSFKDEMGKLYDSKKESFLPISNKDIDIAKQNSIKTILKQFPELYDYFIGYKERDVKNAKEKSEFEAANVINSISENEIVYSDVIDNSLDKEFDSSFEEALYRINFLKNKIENCGLWKSLYDSNGEPLSEEYAQRMFGLAWCRSHFMFSPETNAGIGPADFLISCGSHNSVIIEFKMASNTRLDHVFEQVDKYKESLNTNQKSIIVIFFFNDSEERKALKIKNDSDKEKYVVVLIDCDKSKKKSASKL